MQAKLTLLTLTAAGGLSGASVVQDPEELPDGHWISLSGTIEATSEGAFTIDYGEDDITVEMDDWDWFDESALVRRGERVTVYGRIDDGWFEERTIEASSVYAPERGEVFYASDLDEEGDRYRIPFLFFTVHAADGTWMSVEGTVVNKSGREFTVDTGVGHIVIDTDEMPYDPMDDEGLQRVEHGDHVMVTGPLDIDFFEHPEVKAETLLILKDATASADGSAKESSKSKKARQGSKSKASS